MPPKLLIINPFGIGDVLFTTPFISSLKKNLPDVFIGFICNARAYSVLAENPHIDKIWIFEKDEYRKCWKDSKIKFFKKFLGFLREIKVEHFNTAIDFSLGHQYSFFLMLLGLRERIGYDFKGRGRFLTKRIRIDGYHSKPIARYYLDLLKHLGINTADSDDNLRIYLSEDEKQKAKDLLTKNGLTQQDLIVAIIPGGGASWGQDASYKHWQPEGFAKAADALASKHNAKVIVLGTEDESDICQRVIEPMQSQPVNLCGQTDLREFAGILSLCRVAICNDGGPLHVAIASGTRTVSIFGPVDETVYGPYPPGEDHIVVTSDAQCRPCYKRFRFNKCETKECLGLVSPEAVIEAAEKCI